MGHFYIGTPYVFYLTEDRMFHKTTRKEFSAIMNEVVKNDIGVLQLGKLHKYSLSQFPMRVQEYNRLNHYPWGPVPPYMDNDEHIYTFKSKHTPLALLSVDAIFRKDVFKTVVERVIDTWSPANENKPVILELGKHVAPGKGHEWNWLATGMPDLLCAIPKKEVIVSDDDPGYSKLIKS